jgi:lysophospholipase L1-like esterase
VLRKTRPNTEFWHESVDGRWKFVINAQGFRDNRDYPYTKTAGRLRVITLGDSHTQGYEVNQHETYSAGLERYLRRRGLDSEVFNMGISGIGTAEILAFLESEGLRYRPDVVVYGLSSNDFRDNIRAGLYKLESGHLEVAKREHAPFAGISAVYYALPPLRWLSEHSYAYSITVNSLADALRRKSKRTDEENAALEYAMPVSQMTGVQRALMTALIARMHEVCRANGIRLVVADMPELVASRKFKNAVPDEMAPSLRQHADVYLTSQEILSEYDDITEFHVPHGHRHLSAFTHALYAAALGKTILGFASEPANKTREPR